MRVGQYRVSWRRGPFWDAYRRMGLYLLAAAAVFVVLVVMFTACGNDDARRAEPKTTTATRPSCDYRDDGPDPDCLTVVTRDGMRCALFQPGGPNSARMWCAEGSAAVGGMQ